MSFKLLEISILSAQDLAPVSKLLRTFAVAWVHPDQKLTTRIDHNGHTNPTWNYRFVFHVDDHFLASSSILNIEIYNVSWLRDIPIGSANVLITAIVPQPSQNKLNTRLVSLPIRRPSGILQGMLNLSVSLVDSSTRSMPLDRQLSASTGGDRKLTVSRSQHNQSKRNYENQENEEKEKNAKIKKQRRSQCECTDDESISKSSSIFSGWSKLFKIRKSKLTTAGSTSSYIMRPLPSEVAASMAKGLYSSAEIGSSIFDNWTVVDGVEEVAKPKAVRWKIDEFTPSRSQSKKQRSSGGGLLSCFGILCGYECNIVCGTPKSKNKKKSTKKKRSGENQVIGYHSVENLGLLYR